MTQPGPLSLGLLSGLAAILVTTTIVFVIAKWRWIQLPHSLRAMAVMALVAVSVATLDHSLLIFIIVMLMYLVIAMALILYGFRIHFRPNSNRKTKYELLLSGVCALLVANLHYVPLRLKNLIHLETLEITWIALLTSIVFFVVVQLIISSLIRPWTAVPERFPSKRILRTQRIVRALGLPVVVISVVIPIPIFLIPYLNLRYVLGEHLARAPIIYLRSFQYSDGPAALGRIVGKVASRFGVIFAVVHAEQKGSDLLAHSRLTEQPQVSTVPNEKWRDLIVSRLRACSAVLIDRTVSSDGLQWEIRKAQELVGPSRIGILQRKGTSMTSVPGVWTLEYELGKESEKEARKALKIWFEKVFSVSESEKETGTKAV